MAAPNDGTTNLPSDALSRYCLGIWDGAAFWAPRADNATAKNLKVASYDAAGNPLFTIANPGQVNSRLYDSAGVGLITAGDGDNQASTTLLAAQTRGMRFNGTSWDREYSNVEGTLLASAARTTNQVTAVQTNYNARGVIVVLNVTVASGTGGLTIIVPGTNLGFAWGALLLSATTSIHATGTSTYIVYPGSATTPNIAQISSVPLPRYWYVEVLVGDASSYTYSVDYALIK